MNSRSLLSKVFTLSTLALLLSACGGGSSSSSNGDHSTPTPPNPQPPVSTDLFSAKGKIWTIQPVKDQAYCYDIDSQTALADCSNEDWDIQFQMGARTPTILTNSGVSGTGLGGALSSPFEATWTDLLKERDATQGGQIPSAAWIVDAYNNPFMETSTGFNSFFEYDLFADHRMSPNFKTYFISTDPSNKSVIGTIEKPVFAIQITGYYQGTSSGFIHLRYVNTAQPNEIKTLVVDATTSWQYVNLTNQTTSTNEASNWQIAFNRYNVRLSDTAGSAVALQPEGYYDTEGKPILSQFRDPNALLNTESALLTAAQQQTVSRWGSNAVKSILSPSYQGTYPNKLSYGWYSYYPTLAAAQADGIAKEHMLAANPEAASMIRGNTGKSYARMHLKEIKYSDINDYNSQTTWTFEFDIQPAASSK